MASRLADRVSLDAATGAYAQGVREMYEAGTGDLCRSLRRRAADVVEGGV